MSGSSIAVSGQYNERDTAFSPWKATETWNLINSWEMVSFSNPGYRSSSRGDNGGPWYLHKVNWSATVANKPASGTFKGAFTCGSRNGFSYPAVPAVPSNASLDASGSTAMSRVNPTNPAFSLSQALGELSADGIPSLPSAALWKERTRVAKASGSEFLNVEFGWLPLIGDIRQFAKTVQNSGKILDQYTKDSGQKIRRRYAFPPVEASTSSSGAMFPYPTTAYTSFGSGSTFARTRSAKWFSGAFRYHIPAGNSARDRMARHVSLANKLLGVRLTPSTLWELAPWSWAVDWQSNVGDVINNISNLGNDGLVLQYGYIMHESEMERHDFGVFPAGTVSRSKTEVYRLRRPATPYGFGFNLGGLSAKQTSVLIALGLSHG